MPSNLPPGVTDNMIPGNQPEDIYFDDVVQRLRFDFFADAVIQAHVLKTISESYLMGESATECASYLNGRYYDRGGHRTYQGGTK